MPSTSASSFPKITIWLWPTGLYPRRILYYFHAKSITLSTLDAHNIHLVPVALGTAPPYLASLPGYEERPADTSLPIMRIQHANNDESWVYETQGIFEYLEELFSVEKGYANMKGASSEQRARSRDVLSCLADATTWAVVQLVHSDASTSSWSGVREGDMSPGAAAHAKRRFHMLMGRMEKWVERDVIGRETKSLAGVGAAVTIADLSLMAQIEYARENYGLDWIAEHGVLKVWWERVKNDSWVLGREVLLQAEKSGNWEMVLNK